MKTIHYQVQLLEPAILTAIDGEPNSSISYDFIPGSVMRGLFIGRMIHGNADDFAIHNDMKRLFFSNQTRYLNLYPVIDGQRSLPVPNSLKKAKYPTSEAIARIIIDGAWHEDSGEDIGKTERIKGFVYFTDDSAEAKIYEPRRALNVHTQRARSQFNEQQVYRYDALAAGQIFAGMILCQNDADAATLLDLMNNPSTMNDPSTIHIGGARSAGYGLAEIQNAIEGNWWEVDHQLAETMVVTLLSDVILRDENGQYSPTLEALKRAFERYGITFDYDGHASLETTMVGGFNRKWGLPLPQTLALKRGSVIQLKNVHGDEGRFWEVVKLGLGERTNEGFGQVAFNWQRQAQFVGFKYEPKTSTSEDKVELSDESNAMWNRLQNRIRIDVVESTFASSIFLDDTYHIQGSITPTQLARLRAKIADELRKETPETNFIDTFLGEIKGKAAGKQFENARIQKKSLAEWLKTPTFDQMPASMVKNKGYLLRLIDAVLERGQKERANQQREVV